MFNTNYIIGFIIALTAISAVLLTGLREVTKARADLNEEIFEKRAVLLAVEDFMPEGKKVSDLSDQDVVRLFDTQVEQVALNMEGENMDGVRAEDIDMAKERKKPEPERLLPLYVYNSGGDEFYIVAVRGNGLWDEIWGYIALENDLNTIAGASFDHKQETPGLGAEIKDNPAFPRQFKGKKIYGDNGEFVSVTVKKGGTSGNDHAVDAISGATVTSNGVAEMLYRGIDYYQPYFQKIRRQSLLAR